MTEDGKVLETERIVNDPAALSAAVAKAGPDAEVALESTYGWYWAADVLEADGARVHLVHPLGLHWDARRVKNDERDATELAHRLRRGDLPESWIAPTELRELRELVRYRQRLAALRTSAKAQIHAVMAKLGILPTLSDMFTPAGQVLLDEMPFEGAYAIRVESLRDLLEIYQREIAVVERGLHARLADHKGYHAIQALNGVGPVTAAVFVAEIGDVTRFKDARHLCSWAGLTPTHHESDNKVRRGHITKMACGRPELTWRFRVSSGGDCDHRWRPGCPSSPADVRLRRPCYWRGRDRQDRTSQPRRAALVAQALRGVRGGRVRAGGLYRLALRG
jgi:transposase